MLFSSKQYPHRHPLSWLASHDVVLLCARVLSVKIPYRASAATLSQINSQFGISDTGFYKTKERLQRRSATRLSSLTGFSVVRQLPGLFTLYCFCFFCCQPTLRSTGPASISDLSASHTDGMTPIFPSPILSRLHLHVNTSIRRRSFLGELFLFFFLYLFPKYQVALSAPTLFQQIKWPDMVRIVKRRVGLCYFYYDCWDQQLLFVFKYSSSKKSCP